MHFCCSNYLDFLVLPLQLYFGDFQFFPLNCTFLLKLLWSQALLLYKALPVSYWWYWQQMTSPFGDICAFLFFQFCKHIKCYCLIQVCPVNKVWGISEINSNYMQIVYLISTGGLITYLVFKVKNFICYKIWITNVSKTWNSCKNLGFKTQNS